MIRKIKDQFWKLLNFMGVGGLVQLKLQSELKDNGWFLSYKTKKSVDAHGRPIPWNTYSFILFIEKRLTKDFELFEFGCGNSTLWYAEKVLSIAAVEHDKVWYEQVSKIAPQNVKLIYQELEYGGEYSKAALKENKKYDVIVIDGRDRVNCTINSIDALKPGGIIIFDNSNLPDYDTAYSHLLKLGFKQIEFYGISPVTAHLNCTSIFYKEKNCLGI